jgi:hypothetical protein
MASKGYKLTSKVYVYPGMGGWRFLGLPFKEGREIKEKYGKNARGWGSLPVSITVGNTTWETSIFPDKKSGSYLLPLKAQVRKKEEIDDDEEVQFILKLRR